MIKFEEKIESENKPDTTVTLVRDQREKSRLKVILEDGREAGLFFEKGISFQDGDLIISDDGKVLVEVKAANETVSTVYCDDPLHLARACYHLGNRHIPLQIDKGVLRYQHDHVLDDMVRGLGLDVKTEQAPFEPESGAYSGGGHHGHSHDH
ncbi:MAG: urease accessory protein UreE [Thiotrichaceae bacterium]|nr:urease accessory protein UreE [Thiotrichaceae bacterium]